MFILFTRSTSLLDRLIAILRAAVQRNQPAHLANSLGLELTVWRVDSGGGGAQEAEEEAEGEAQKRGKADRNGQQQTRWVQFRVKHFIHLASVHQNNILLLVFTRFRIP